MPSQYAGQLVDLDDDDFYDRPDCRRCDGSGEINICIDDMCANSDECIHGDGIIMCPDCGGMG